MNDEPHKRDTPTSALSQEALLNMLPRPNRNSRLRAPPSGVLGLQVPCTPQVDPLPSTVLSKQDEGTASLQYRSSLRR
jgi:hypothetical protein